MTAFDAVLLFLIPQIFRNYLIGADDSLLTAVVGATTLLVLVFVTSLFGFRSITLGRLVRATPTVLAEDGVLVDHALNREHVTRKKSRPLHASQASMGSQASAERRSKPTARSRLSGADPFSTFYSLLTAAITPPARVAAGSR